MSGHIRFRPDFKNLNAAHHYYNHHRRRRHNSEIFDFIKQRKLAMAHEKETKDSAREKNRLGTEKTI